MKKRIIAWEHFEVKRKHGSYLGENVIDRI